VADGFLGRWSRRKLDVQEGKPVPPEPAAVPGPPNGNATPASPPATSAVQGSAGGSTALPADVAAPEKPALPTLDDVGKLTRESDFSAFTRPGVDPAVRNAAMKKLFSDPHYNVMDGLDIYIDDYSKPDPIPPAMLRQLASARFLNLFGDEEKEAAAAISAAPEVLPEQAAAAATPNALSGQREVLDNPTARTVAHSGAPDTADLGAASIPDHADPDLRLQQDDAPAGKDPGAGAG
jgi:hypothetical protein